MKLDMLILFPVHFGIMYFSENLQQTKFNWKWNFEITTFANEDVYFSGTVGLVSKFWLGVVENLIPSKQGQEWMISVYSGKKTILDVFNWYLHDDFEFSKLL